MDTADIVNAVLALIAIWLGVRSYRQDSKTQDRLLAIEEDRHAWEQEQREREEEQERIAAEAARSATFQVWLEHRSQRGTSRLVALNRGPEEAFEVVLDVWGDRGNGREEVGRYGGNYHEVDRLGPGETAHIDMSFTMGRPSRDDLRYRLDWTDSRGPQTMEGRVPLI